MGIIKKMKDFFSKEKPEVKKEIPNEDVIFNVDNFNEWFCDPNNNAVYANKGIFLRVDKLSDAQVIDYLEKKYGIENGGPFLWSKPTWSMISDFIKDIRKDWMDKNSNFDRYE